MKTFALAVAVLAFLTPALPASARETQPPQVVLTMGGVDRDAPEFACRIPFSMTRQGDATVERMQVAVQALDAQGRTLEASGFALDELPIVGAVLPDRDRRGSADIQFSRSACQDMRTVLITTAVCTIGGLRTPRCIDYLVIRDDAPDDRVAILANRG